MVSAPRPRRGRSASGPRGRGQYRVACGARAHHHLAGGGRCRDLRLAGGACAPARCGPKPMI